MDEIPNPRTEMVPQTAAHREALHLAAHAIAGRCLLKDPNIGILVITITPDALGMNVMAMAYEGMCPHDVEACLEAALATAQSQNNRDDRG